MKVLIGLVVLVATGLGLYLGMSYRIDVGASSANPLGDFAKIEKELTGMGLRKEQPPQAEVQSLFDKRFKIEDGMTSTAFLDRVPGLKHQTIVVRNAQGKVVAVLCHFRSGALAFSKTGTKCENFAALYWMTLSGGKEPKLTKEMEEGSDRREYLLAKFTKGPVDAMWKKEGGSAVITMVPQDIADVVTFILR